MIPYSVALATAAMMAGVAAEDVTNNVTRESAAIVARRGMIGGMLATGWTKAAVSRETGFAYQTVKDHAVARTATLKRAVPHEIARIIAELVRMDAGAKPAEDDAMASPARVQQWDEFIRRRGTVVTASGMTKVYRDGRLAFRDAGSPFAKRLGGVQS